METQFTEKVRFNQLEEGEVFTFRRNGILTENPNDKLLRYDTSCAIDGIWLNYNVMDHGGGRCTIKNLRSWAWRVPRKESSSVPPACKGCVNAWAVPSHEKCQRCSRMYTDHYIRKEN